MDALGRTLKASGIVLALVIAILAAHPAAADTNTGNGPQTLRDRVAFQRQFCGDLGGSFSVNLQASQATATTTCSETGGSTTTCTHSTSSSSCKTTPPPEAPGGTGAGPWAVDTANVDAEITPAEGPRTPRRVGTLAVGQSLIVDETGDGGTESLQETEAEPGVIEPVETEPIAIEAAEDEDA